MVFNSLIFLAFLAVVLPVYYRLGHRAQNWFLLFASWFFYGWWNVWFLGLLWFTSLFDYFCAHWIERTENPRRRKWLLAGSMTVNLTVLGVFKYFNFFADSAANLLGAFGFHADAPTLRVILPIGISFYTFLSMSYTIDVYRRELKATARLVDYQLFVCYFPHLVAGPIVRASYLLPQCERPRVIKPDQVVNGIWLVLLGYFKKVVLGDRLAQAVNWGFAGHAAPLADANAWLVVYAFAFQIYADFSGYSDIARGLSKLMGFELVENFKSPYLVTNPSDFWRHWHISLSTWLRDYLYFSLGGNRLGRLRTYLNLMLTMILGGLWHGAGAAFLLWGFFHGALLAVHRLWTQLFGRGESKSAAAPDTKTGARAKFSMAVRAILFFHVGCLGWLLFRAGSLPKNVNQVDMVKSYLHAMFTLPHGADPLLGGVLLCGAVTLFLQWKNSAMQQFATWPARWRVLGVTSVLLCIASLGVFEGAQFIYFQF
jgi:alginate O-acetyltransferase complex protein AlgI